MSERQFSEVNPLRGRVVILKTEGEQVEGLTTHKPGRTIGEDETDTLELLNVETGELYLIPMSAVIRNNYEAAKIKMNGEHFYMRICYKGKRKNSSGKEYNDFKIEMAESVQSDLDALAAFESNQ